MVIATRLTYQDYLNTPGDERYELLDGELILVASPNEDHQTASIERRISADAHDREGE